jgi:FkbM family methyltransferase
MLKRLKRIRSILAALGPITGLRYLAFLYVWRPFRNRFWDPGFYTLRTAHAAFPLQARSHSSDLQVFHQIFVALEYECLAHLQNVDLVIDCGGNVGYSAAYFLTKFPQCRLITVEPDPENFEMLCKNLAPYGDRVVMHRAGIWSHSTGLVISEVPYRDGQQWTRQVRECRPGEEPQFHALDVGSLLQQSGESRISLLKMDIEGAEVVVFTDDRYRAWLPKVDAMAVELHDDSQFGRASDIFFPAIASEGFELSTSRELTICLRKPAGPA